MTKTEQLKSELSAAELTKKEAELNIADLKARLEGESAEPPERAAANKYLRKKEYDGYLKSLHPEITRNYLDRNIIAGFIVDAHEAGQKYGAETEREKTSIQDAKHGFIGKVVYCKKYYNPAELVFTVIVKGKKEIEIGTPCILTPVED